MSRLPVDTVGGRSSTLHLGVEAGDRPAVILRDAQVLPALRAIVEDGLLHYLDQARQNLTEPLGARGRRHQRVGAATRAAIDLHTWRALAPLGDAEAAELIELAAGT